MKHPDRGPLQLWCILWLQKFETTRLKDHKCHWSSAIDVLLLLKISGYRGIENHKWRWGTMFLSILLISDCLQDYHLLQSKFWSIEWYSKKERSSAFGRKTQRDGHRLEAISGFRRSRPANWTTSTVSNSEFLVLVWNLRVYTTFVSRRKIADWQLHPSHDKKYERHSNTMIEEIVRWSLIELE